MTTMQEPLFRPFPKIPRMSRECVVTEKLDGTNAQIIIRELPDGEEVPTDTPLIAVVGKRLLYAASRNRLLTTAADNFGFARWVKALAEELAQLGPGRHFGEWWGVGVQRGYGVSPRRFSLFNPDFHRGGLPACVGSVPVLYRGVFSSAEVDRCVESLRLGGSVAAPGFMQPEGVVCFHVAASVLFKKTLEDDESPKSVAPCPAPQ